MEPTKKTEKARANFYLSREALEKLDLLRKIEQRSRSNYLQVLILRQHLQEKVKLQ